MKVQLRFRTSPMFSNIRSRKKNIRVKVFKMIPLLLPVSTGAFIFLPFYDIVSVLHWDTCHSSQTFSIFFVFSIFSVFFQIINSSFSSQPFINQETSKFVTCRVILDEKSLTKVTRGKTKQKEIFLLNKVYCSINEIFLCDNWNDNFQLSHSSNLKPTLSHHADHVLTT